MLIKGKFAVSIEEVKEPCLLSSHGQPNLELSAVPKFLTTSKRDQPSG